MTQTAHSNRPDMDIEADIIDVIAHYPPLQADRYHLHIEVRDGEVILSGHVRSMISRRTLLERAAQVRGVSSVSSGQLYDEETIRMEAGQQIARGVIANVKYGAVILTGAQPEGMTSEDVARSVSLIPGVERVVTRFE
ncbi:MAG: BON domain-containing protein [Chloroflexota bacterium]